MNTFKKWLSYWIPQREKTYFSHINGQLEINWQDGKRVLDTAVSNYSYGNLQKILHYALQQAHFCPREVQSVLLLGLGGGSVVETLRKNFGYMGPITCIDIDPLIISLAKEEFQIERFAPLEILCQDAAVYVTNSNRSFDWIIVDIFIGKCIPDSFTKSPFLQHLARITSAKGQIIFNTMLETLSANQLKEMASSLADSGLATRILWQVSHTNNLILAKKVQ